MRNIWAVHRPIPRTAENLSMISSSDSLPNPSTGTVPSSTLDARSLIEAALAAESPADRSLSSGRASTAPDVRFPSKRAANRAWMAEAAGPASCW